MIYDNTDLEIVALTLFMEARGEGESGIKAVAQVIKNRAYAKGTKTSDECLRKYQFSCWNNWTNEKLHNINKQIERESKAWQICVEIARQINKGVNVSSEVGKANHYHTLCVNPSWNRKAQVVKVIGNHIFYYL